jgi:hypothetical protein
MYFFQKKTPALAQLPHLALDNFFPPPKALIPIHPSGRDAGKPM